MKNEISEQLRLLAKQIIEKDTLQTSQIKQTALELYTKSAMLEYVEHREESSSFKTNTSDDISSRGTTLPKSPESSDLQEQKGSEEDVTAEEPKAQEQKEDIAVNENKKSESKKEFNSKSPLNELELFASEFQNMPEFERKPDQDAPKTNSDVQRSSTKPNPDKDNSIHKKLTASKPKSLNDTIKQGLHIGLNDRLAFINHLFEGQTEDYTRVLSQINTFDSFEEAKGFIKNQVKPDYNNWQNKEKFSNRFMAIIEKTFN